MVEFEDTEAAAAAEAVREVAEGHQPKDGAMTWGSSSSSSKTQRLILCLRPICYT